MGFDNARQRETEHEAYLLLWNLWRSSRRVAARINNWESACEMLRTFYG